MHGGACMAAHAHGNRESAFCTPAGGGLEGAVECKCWQLAGASEAPRQRADKGRSLIPACARRLGVQGVRGVRARAGRGREVRGWRYIGRGREVRGWPYIGRGGLRRGGRARARAPGGASATLAPQPTPG